MSEKNFDELEIGCFYLTALGYIEQIKEKATEDHFVGISGSKSYRLDGRSFYIDTRDWDLVTKIERLQKIDKMNHQTQLEQNQIIERLQGLVEELKKENSNLKKNLLIEVVKNGY